MVYLAGDNDLETFGNKDLLEMKTAGSTDAVAIVAQFDCMADSVTRRYYLTRERTLNEDCVAHLPEINTGDPAALSDFVLWAASTYPAEHMALILWNHGAGWKDDDIYQAAERAGVTAAITRSVVRSVGASKTRRALFATSLQQLVEAAETERAILFDDTSADFLDNRELRQVLSQIVTQLGRPLDLVGFDACLMNMIEVAYQVRDLCHIIVGSQEVEPGDGWPYGDLLPALMADPTLTPAALARHIVACYMDYYRTHHPDAAVTQSAVDLTGMETTAAQIGELGKTLQTLINSPAGLGRIFAALRMAQTFSDRDYVDLTHFCRLLADGSDDPVAQHANTVSACFTADKSPVIAEGHHGEAVANAGGLSIYLPIRTHSPLYRHLDFAQRHGWDEFIEALVNPR
jgi:hypothetical protein